MHTREAPEFGGGGVTQKHEKHELRVPFKNMECMLTFPRKTTRETIKRRV